MIITGSYALLLKPESRHRLIAFELKPFYGLSERT